MKPARRGAQLGLRRLRALRVILPDSLPLAECDRLVAAGEMAGQHAIICGVQAAVAGTPVAAALGAYFYQGLAAAVGASLKLIRIGQDAVQRVLRAASVRAPWAVAPLVGSSARGGRLVQSSPGNREHAP